jgi:hypothetical protein
VTIIGQALPWSDVLEAFHAGTGRPEDDHAIAADIAAARATGALAATTEEAWGNAAIPGFGIGRPTQLPALDPQARRPSIEDPDAFDDSLEPYTIPDDSLVLGRGPGSEMAIYLGAPDSAVRHHDLAFLLGISGAVMAVVSALGLGSLLAGTL